jgi:hypothetical protein
MFKNSIIALKDFLLVERKCSSSSGINIVVCGPIARQQL